MDGRKVAWTIPRWGPLLTGDWGEPRLRMHERMGGRYEPPRAWPPNPHHSPERERELAEARRKVSAELRRMEERDARLDRLISVLLFVFLGTMIAVVVYEGLKALT